MLQIIDFIGSIPFLVGNSLIQRMIRVLLSLPFLVIIHILVIIGTAFYYVIQYAVYGNSVYVSIPEDEMQALKYPIHTFLSEIKWIWLAHVPLTKTPAPKRHKVPK